MPFLPGDSLLFMVGALASRPDSPLALGVLYPLLFAAALIGDNANYHLGRTVGRKWFGDPNSKVFRRENLEKTEAFFAKHGGKSVVYARFVPVVRTFAPFVAGMGAMPYPRFLGFSMGGALLWVGICMTAGVFFGQLAWVKKYFELVIVAIVAISLLPAVLEFRAHRRAAAAPDA
ncbi:MAG: VTT domain-containing protein, partial [Armatimonadota bacterium]